MTKRGRLVVALVVVSAIALCAGPAWAWPLGQALTPSPSPGPSVDGTVTGGTAAGASLDIRVDASMPGGWRGLNLVEVSLVAGGRELERITYDTENTRLGIGGYEMFLGSADQVRGRYLEINGVDVAVTTGGTHLSTMIPAAVVRPLPANTRFRLSVTADDGRIASVTRDIAAPGSTGFSWGTVVALIAAALLAGALAGNLIASRRRPPPRLSVYGAIQRQIDAGTTPSGHEP